MSYPSHFLANTVPGAAGSARPDGVLPRPVGKAVALGHLSTSKQGLPSFLTGSPFSWVFFLGSLLSVQWSIYLMVASRDRVHGRQSLETYLKMSPYAHTCLRVKVSRRF